MKTQILPRRLVRKCGKGTHIIAIHRLALYLGATRCRGCDAITNPGEVQSALIAKSSAGELISDEAEKPWQPPSGLALERREAAEQDRHKHIEAEWPYTLSELAQALSSAVSARKTVLTSSQIFAYRTGDLLWSASRNGRP